MNTKDAYELWHKLREQDIYMEEPEYYRLVGALIKNSKSVDIGCGYGSVEFYSPDTVGVDFSTEALERARKLGVKNLVNAPAENLPFKDNEFEIAVSIGTLEHVENLEKAISEITRISEIQILVVHAALPFPIEFFRSVLNKIFGFKDQPLERPQRINDIKKLLKKNGARTLIEGTWNYIDLRWIHPKIPYGLVKWPSHHVTFSIKTDNLDRQFLGDLDIKSKR